MVEQMENEMALHTARYDLQQQSDSLIQKLFAHMTCLEKSITHLTQEKEDLLAALRQTWYLPFDFREELTEKIDGMYTRRIALLSGELEDVRQAAANRERMLPDPGFSPSSMSPHHTVVCQKVFEPNTADEKERMTQ